MIFASNQITSALFSPNKHDIDAKQFRAFSIDEREAFYELRAAKTDILEAAQALISCFNYSKAGNQLAIALNKSGEKTQAMFFRMFVCASHAMAVNLKHIDMRNEQTAEVSKIISAYNFESAQEVTAPKRPVDVSDVDSNMVEKMTHSLKTMMTTMDEYNISVETAGSILASAWFFNHPTIQQSFMRDTLKAAEVMLYQHQKHEHSIRTLMDVGLVKVLSGLVGIANNHNLPMI